MFIFQATSTCKTAENVILVQPFSGLTEQKVYQNIENEEKQSRAKPSQEAMKNKIDLLEINLNALYSVKDTMPSHIEVEKQIIKSHKELKAVKVFKEKDSKCSIPEKNTEIV